MSSADLPFNAPQHAQGPFIIVAHITAKDGQADKVATYLKAARKSAESAAEPGVLTYRTTREEKPGGDKFLVFEEYTSLEALKAHVAEEPFQTLAAAGVIADLTITYYEEMK